MPNKFVEDKNFYKLVLILVGLLSILVFVKIIGEARGYRFIGSSPDVRSVISVSGEGEVFAIPDIATFSFGATASASTAGEAQQAITEKLNAVMEYLKEQEIEDKDIKTVSYNVYPKYEQAACTPTFCPPSTGEISGYEANQMIEVKVRNTKNAGALISGVTDRGANNVSGVTFSIDEEDVLRAEARVKAIQDAKSKAMKLAKDLDVKLVRIVEFNESGVGMPSYVKYEAMDARGAAAPVAAPLPAGENKISSQVTITYEIR